MRTRLSILLVFCACLFFLVMCGGGGGDDRAVDNGPNDDDDDNGDAPGPVDDDATDDDVSDDDTASIPCPNEYCVLEEEDLGAEWDCENPAGCIDDYLAFVGKAVDYVDPITEAELEQQLYDMSEGRIEQYTEPLPADVLASELITGLNNNFLLADMYQRLLRVTVIDRQDYQEGYDATIMLFTDPWIGTFKGILLVPEGKGPFPTVLAMHGHGSSAENFFWSHDGEEFPARRYAILAITLRAMGAGVPEDQVSRTLLLNGFALKALRSYESLLALRYLQYHPQVDNDRIGLIGHSGGSSTNNLTVRFADGFAACVTDLVNTGVVDYDGGRINCEDIPRVYPYFLLTNDFASAPVPMLKVPYNFENEIEEIFDFFDEHLK